MVIRITVEAIVYSLLYTAFMLVLFRIQGAKYIGCYFHTHLHEKPEYSILFRMCIQLRLCCNPFFNSPRLNCRWIIVKLVFYSLDSK